MIKLYIAGSWENRDSILEYMRIARNYNYVIVGDWTGHKESGYNNCLNYANSDFQGVLDSDIFIIDSKHKTSGKFVELGIALAIKKPIFVRGQLTTVFKTLIPQDHYFENFEILINSDPFNELVNQLLIVKRNKKNQKRGIIRKVIDCKKCKQQVRLVEEDLEVRLECDCKVVIIEGMGIKYPQDWYF